jgi:SET domain-containing protein
MTVENLETHYSAGLAMTFVATQDIQPGEEIFLDYGDSWEKAWNEHVEKWTPAKGDVGAPSAEEPNSK